MKIFWILLAVGGMAFGQMDRLPELGDVPPPAELPPIEVRPPAPLNGKLVVTFSGQESFGKGELRAGIMRQIQSIEMYGLDEAGAYDAAFFLESFYRKKGFAEVEVTSRIGPRGQFFHIDIHEREEGISSDVSMEANQSPASSDPFSKIAGSSLRRALEPRTKPASLARCPASRERRN